MVKSWWTVLVVLVAGAAAAAAVALAAFPRHVPRSVAGPSGTATVAVRTTSIDDAQQVAVSVSFGSEQHATVRLDGTVTSSACVPGGRLRSGGAVLAVDGVPVVGLATAAPLWRSLKIGDGGADVIALRAALRSWQPALPARGSFDAALQAVLDRVYRTAGGTPAGTGFRLDRWMWLPERTPLVQSCAVAVGDTVTAGAPVLTYQSAPTRAWVTQLPDGLVPGPRLLRIDGVQAAVDQNGVIESRAALLRLVTTPGFRAWQARGTGEPLSATLVLATPLSVAAVPTSAVATAAGSCVFTADAKALPVRIVSSSFGVTYVSTSGTRPSRVLINPPAEATCG